MSVSAATKPHIVWDWNGTLFDDVELIVASANHAFGQAGLEPVTVERYRERFTVSAAGLFRRLFGEDPTSDTLLAMNNAYQEYYRAHRGGCPLTVDALDCLREWRQADGTQSLLSLHPYEDLLALVRDRAVGDYFDEITGRFGVADGKYDLLVRHLERLAGRGIPAERVVMIGDTLDDAQCAERAGVRVILYSGGLQLREALEEVNVPVSHSLREAVAKAGEESRAFGQGLSAHATVLVKN